MCFAVCGAGLEGSTACKSCRGYYIMDYDFEAGASAGLEGSTVCKGCRGYYVTDCDFEAGAYAGLRSFS